MLCRLFGAAVISANPRVAMPEMTSLQPRVSAILPRQPTRAASWSPQLIWRTPYVQTPVVDVSVLRTLGQRVPLSVIDSSVLSRAGSKIAAGRSKGHKVSRRLPDGSLQYFYYKLPYFRGGFVKELIAAALARHLLGEQAPAVYAVEKPEESDARRAQYALVSESLGTNVQYDNLESWAFLYEQDDEELRYGPKHLGLALAFKLLLGDSDAKAANFVLLRNQQGNCYSIDHEYAFDLAPAFIRDSSSAVSRLKDFRTDQQDRYIPLQANPALLQKIEPVLERAVQCDLDDGSVMALYERFASLTEADIQTMFDRYGSLINEDEKASITQDLRYRQADTREFIESYEREQQLIEDFRQTLKLRR